MPVTSVTRGGEARGGAGGGIKRNMDLTPSTLKYR